ncbi:MAG: response regulator [Bacteroidia bacterium]
MLMERLYIICIDDQREVLDAISKDLAPLEGPFLIEECESAEEALDVLEDIDAEGGYPAVIVSDHVMPEKNGVEFLVEVNQDSRFVATKKILLTGLATHQDTIQAINYAAIDKYIEKPWKADALVQQVRILLTSYILDKGLDYEPFRSYLDLPTLLEKLRKSS